MGVLSIRLGVAGRNPWPQCNLGACRGRSQGFLEPLRLGTAAGLHRRHRNPRELREQGNRRQVHHQDPLRRCAVEGIGQPRQHQARRLRDGADLHRLPSGQASRHQCARPARSAAGRSRSPCDGARRLLQEPLHRERVQALERHGADVGPAAAVGIHGHRRCTDDDGRTSRACACARWAARVRP